MSLTTSDPTRGTVVHTAVGQQCFYCGQDTADPAVYWAGMTGEIYLHPPCVEALTVRLLRDVHEHENPAYYMRRHQDAR